MISKGKSSEAIDRIRFSNSREGWDSKRAGMSAVTGGKNGTEEMILKK